MAAGVVRLPRRLPLLALSDTVLLPGGTLRIPVKSTKGMSMVRNHLLNSSLSLAGAIIGVVTWEPGEEGNGLQSLHKIGTGAIVVQVHGTNWPQPLYSLLLTGLCRFRIDDLIQENPYPIARVTQLDQFGSSEADNDVSRNDDKELKDAIQDFSNHIQRLIDAMESSGLRGVGGLKKMLGALPKERLVDVCASILKGSLTEKLQVLDAVDLTERFQKALPLVLRQLEALKSLHQGRNSQPIHWSEPVKKRQVTDAIQEAESEDTVDDALAGNDDAIALSKKLKAAKMPKEVDDITQKELKRLAAMPQAMPEYAMLRTYLEIMAELPWAKSTKDNLDLDNARNQLDADHYGLDSTKKRLLEFLAVRQLKNSLKGPILCLVGPPGVGKTSIGKSIAVTLGRQFDRISLGGVADESEIRGHRRTYIGAMPGRLMQSLRRIQANNPVILLDEIDKLGESSRGNPAAALLEVLDPEQNHTFTDHYLGVPFDLSQVLFIATANSQNNIPGPLLDRMEVIKLPGYTQEDKLQIAQRHLLKKQYGAHGLNAEHISIPEETLKLMVRRYTYEAGVRALERRIGAICRAVAVRVASAVRQTSKIKDHAEVAESSTGDQASLPQRFPIVIDEAAAQDILGPPPYSQTDITDRLLVPGTAVALAWSPNGGDILFVEAIHVPGDGKLVLTGQLGEVMRESAQLAKNWLGSHARQLGIEQELLNTCDIHIHVPEGAVGKDGPSAGVALVSTLVSLFTGKVVRSDTAMTGEISLIGLVLPVGGIKEKVLAAHRAGLSRIILPHKNEKDLLNVPASVKNDITFVLVRTVNEVLQAAFDEDAAIPDEPLPAQSKL